MAQQITFRFYRGALEESAKLAQSQLEKSGFPTTVLSRDKDFRLGLNIEVPEDTTLEQAMQLGALIGVCEAQN